MSPVTDKVAHFFGFTKKEFETNITTINQLMPEFISNIHDQLIHNMVDRGYSYIVNKNRRAFLVDSKQFIQTIKLHIDNFFLYDNDFCMNGCVLKYQSSSEYLIFSTEGKILGITQGVYRKLFDCEFLDKFTDESFGIKTDGVKYLYDSVGF